VAVHRAGTSLVNWYLLEEGGRVTVVDAGLPGYRGQLEPALAQIGRTIADVEAVVLTHAHIDHIGFAARLQDEHGTPVWLHAAELPQASTGKQPKTEAHFAPQLPRYRTLRRIVAHIVRHGGARPPKLRTPTLYADGDVLDVPGRPVAVHAPGHAPGLCALHVPAEGALFVGDAICGWSTVTGAEGPILPPREFNQSTEQARASLARLEGLDAQTVYFGHGEPWTRGAAAAVAQARERRDR
jgi:glyoxylase-like metal-dependent hydrolase (beta-lactamase superfamily II)